MNKTNKNAAHTVRGMHQAYITMDHSNNITVIVCVCVCGSCTFSPFSEMARRAPLPNDDTRTPLATGLDEKSGSNESKLLTLGK